MEYFASPGPQWRVFDEEPRTAARRGRPRHLPGVLQTVQSFNKVSADTFFSREAIFTRLPSRPPNKKEKKEPSFSSSALARWGGS